MWAEIMRYFSDSPAQTKVVKFLLENGFGVNDRARITCNDVEIPATHIAKAIGTDRRVVDATGQRIAELPDLRDLFRYMRVTPDLSRVADTLGLTVITIHPRNAQEKGIIGAAVGVLHSYNLGIRQIFVNDPYFSENPRLVIIIDGTVPPGVVEQLRGLPQIKSITI
ncbi:MAG: regulator of amino acid metabolism, contains ACT domain protein [Methanomicrobiales archaeon]|nr:regulator of amino acid metabolism, contains ACT domain protein [Methanomicrobiales archaeon]